MSDLPPVEKEAGTTVPVEEKKKREYKDFGHDEAEATRTCLRVALATACRAYAPVPSDAKVDMSQIELKAEDLYDKEKVDLETIVLEDVFTLLQTTDAGLTGEEATRRLGLFGPNKLESEEQNPFLQVRAAAHAARAVRTLTPALSS
jgi:H+-transporting ATPase